MKKSQQKNKLFDRLVTVLLVVITMACFGVVLQTALTGDVTLFGHRIFYVTTGSMEPTIPVGSLLWVDVETQDYQVGDVITFTSKDSAIYGLPNTHRIVEVLDEGYRTQGDANSAPDLQIVASQDIIGEMDGQVTMLSSIGPLISFASTKWGFLLLILCPLLLATLACMREFLKVYQEEVRKAAQEQLQQIQTPPSQDELTDKEEKP